MAINRSMSIVNHVCVDWRTTHTVPGLFSRTALLDSTNRDKPKSHTLTIFSGVSYTRHRKHVRAA